MIWLHISFLAVPFLQERIDSAVYIISIDKQRLDSHFLLSLYLSLVVCLKLLHDALTVCMPLHMLKFFKILVPKSLDDLGR